MKVKHNISCILINYLYINLRRSRDCLCVSVAAGRCGFVGLWVCGFVGLWVCEFVGLCLSRICQVKQNEQVDSKKKEVI